MIYSISATAKTGKNFNNMESMTEDGILKLYYEERASVSGIDIRLLETRGIVNVNHLLTDEEIIKKLYFIQDHRQYYIKAK